MDGVMLLYILLVQCGTFWFVCVLVQASLQVRKSTIGDPSEINNTVCKEERKVILPIGIYIIRHSAQYKT